MMEDFDIFAQPMIVQMALGIIGINTVAHCVIAAILISGHELAQPLWERIVPDVPYERPGSGIKYAVATSGAEAWAVIYWLMSGDLSRELPQLFHFEIFAVCGSNAYDTMVLSKRARWDVHSQNALLFGSLNAIALHYYDPTGYDSSGRGLSNIGPDGQEAPFSLHPGCVFMCADPEL